MSVLPTPMSKKLLLLPLLVLLLVPVFLLLDGGETGPTANGAASAESDEGRPAAAVPADLRAATSTAPEITSAAAPTPTQTAGPRASEERRSAARTSARREGPKVQGRVVDEDGNPIAEAEVKMKRPGEAFLALAGLSTTRTEEDVTDALGRFDVSGKPGEEVTFEVSAPGFLGYEESLVLPEDLGAPIEDLVLEEGLVVWGRVVDPNGNPVVGAGITEGQFWGFRRANTDPDLVTDENGAFELSAQEPGEWSLLVEAEGHPRRIYKGTDEDPGRRFEELVCELPFALTIEGEIVGAPRHRLTTLRVIAKDTEDSTGRFFGGLPPATADLLPDGSFVVAGLDPDKDYEVTAYSGTDPSLMFTSGREDAARSTELVVPAGTKGIELPYVRGADVTFEVVAADTGEPVEDFVAEIGQLLLREEIVEPSGEVRTHHPGGRDRFVDLRPMAMDTGDSNLDRWTLTIDAPGYVPLRKEGLYVPNTGEVDAGLFELQPAPSVTIRVVDDVTGKPVRSAQVVLSVETPASDAEEGMSFIFGQLMAEPSRRERTGKNGEVTIASYGTRPSSLRVSKARYATYEEAGLVVGESDKTVEVRLAEEGEVLVEVLDGDGEPMGDTRVLIRPPDHGEGDDLWDERTRSDGTAVVRKMKAGTWGFRLDLSRNRGWERNDDDEDSPPWTEVAVAPGAELRVVLRGPRFATVTGTVRLDGEPLGEGRVLLFPREGTDSDTYDGTVLFGWTPNRDDLDSGGEFELDEIAYADYWLAVESEALATRWVEPVTVNGAEERLTIRCSTATVTGRVVDRDGQPVAGAAVRVSPAQNARGGNWWPSEVEAAPERQSSNSAVVEVTSLLSLAEPTDDQNRTDASGNFRVTGVPPGTELIVQAGGDLVQPGRSEPFVVEAGELKEGLRVEVDVAGAMSVVVLRDEDSDFRFCRVRLESLEEGQAGKPRSYSDQLWGEQTFNRGGMVPGRYRLEVRKSSFGTWRIDDSAEPDYEATVQVVAGERTVHEARLP